MASFTVDGHDLTSDLNALLNAHGGTNGEYNLYMVDLGSLLSDLLDGSASVVLNLQGPGLTTTTTTFNGANYIFSTLSITTQVNGGPTVPEPATLSLLGAALAALGLRRRW